MEDRRDEFHASEKSRRARLLVWVILVASAVLWAAVAVVPFLPMSGEQKVRAVGALAVAGEAAFWIAAVVLGREAVRRYRSLLNPRNWFGEERR